jgi:hypothetical protein
VIAGVCASRGLKRELILPVLRGRRFTPGVLLRVVSTLTAETRSVRSKRPGDGFALERIRVRSRSFLRPVALLTRRGTPPTQRGLEHDPEKTCPAPR